ncbi:magnesium/cobalt transporter CorA [Nitrosomonas sp.]|uniref:magnesium/cobalt transporter CorA n=1 Tax=Nitrosomonas sp. TaxID=42353 RepID=UPI0025D18726|nr:magnesium/cobalt transporter CorA [Nitrosomonas sp.]MCC6916391.1 magnesium/cobalt transporter CorA [Nitrosomonas sp.]
MKHKTATHPARSHKSHTRNYRPGASPGSLELAKDEKITRVPLARLSLLRYGKEGLIEERHDIAITDCGPPETDATDITWLHLQGLPAPEQLRILGQTFGLHPLALEDVLHQEARAKIEAYDNHQFIVLNHIHRTDEHTLIIDQISFFPGKNYLISISENRDDTFESVRQRIRGMGKICTYGADYLLYALIDVIVDNGFPLLEELGDELESLEDEILDDPSREARNRIHYARRKLVLMRRAWWPQREIIAELMRDDGRFLSETTHLYMRDCYDHCVIVIDFVETYREMAYSLLDTYLSAVSQRMNDIMKALTIIATIFLPLMFITGLYGMNFDTSSPWNLPELHWRFGYIYVLGVMIMIVIGMLIYFRRKRWL